MSIAAFAPRYLHTMLRVHRLRAMLGFYCGALGMHELRRIEFPEQRYTLVFIGYSNAPQNGSTSHNGHIGIGVRDIVACCAALCVAGIAITRDPAPMRPGGRVLALLGDPEGNEVELLASD